MHCGCAQICIHVAFIRDCSAALTSLLRAGNIMRLDLTPSKFDPALQDININLDMIQSFLTCKSDLIRANQLPPTTLVTLIVYQTVAMQGNGAASMSG